MNSRKPMDLTELDIAVRNSLRAKMYNARPAPVVREVINRAAPLLGVIPAENTSELPDDKPGKKTMPAAPKGAAPANAAPKTPAPPAKPAITRPASRTERAAAE